MYSPDHTGPLSAPIDNMAFIEPGPMNHTQVAQIVYEVLPPDLELNESKTWRVMLAPANINYRDQRAIEIRSDIVVGFDPSDDGQIDLNLASWEAQNYGVSRRHVKLRPSRNKLFAIDLGSTNGTHINGLPLGLGWAYALRDRDLITLGRLNLRIRIVHRP
ncbi:MAG: FHA domain-containing protein [Chloroflexi bacterium]|nr:FHA domain-containing protein [Chloroflexota bacterium]